MLQLKNKEEKIQPKKIAGGEEERSKPDLMKKKRRLVERRKVDVLNRVIFPSVANITTFLEYLYDPYLHEIFDKDLQALFFAQSKNPNQKNKEYIIRRFISTIIMHQVGYRDNGDREQSKSRFLPDYRFIICEWMQIALWEMVMGNVGISKRYTS